MMKRNLATPAALYLAVLGIGGHWIGILLWPAVAGHAALSVLLGRAWAHSRRQDRIETPQSG